MYVLPCLYLIRVFKLKWSCERFPSCTNTLVLVILKGTICDLYFSFTPDIPTCRLTLHSDSRVFIYFGTADVLGKSLHPLSLFPKDPTNCLQDLSTNSMPGSLSNLYQQSISVSRCGDTVRLGWYIVNSTNFLRDLSMHGHDRLDDCGGSSMSQAGEG